MQVVAKSIIHAHLWHHGEFLYHSGTATVDFDRPDDKEPLHTRTYDEFLQMARKQRCMYPSMKSDRYKHVKSLLVR